MNKSSKLLDIVDHGILLITRAWVDLMRVTSAACC